MLQVLGIGEAEQRVYETLLDRPGLPLTDLAGIVGLSAQQTRQAVHALESKGLLTRSPGRRRIYPSPPEPSLEALFLRREQELQEARRAIGGVVERWRGATRPLPGHLVDVVEGPEAYAQQFLQLQRAATREVVAFDKPPYGRSVAGCDEVVRERMGAGVRYRAIYTRASLEQPGYLDGLREVVVLGQEARAVRDVPVKLAIADERLALLALDVGPDGPQSGALVHASAVLDSLVGLFEATWERAAPIRFSTGETPPVFESPLSPKDEEILALLGAGLKDRAIARQMGVGLSTVQRRVRRVMRVLGAESRFQAGLRAAEMFRSL